MSGEITEATIPPLVGACDARVRAHPPRGPVFDAAVALSGRPARFFCPARHWPGDPRRAG